MYNRKPCSLTLASSNLTASLKAPQFPLLCCISHPSLIWETPCNCLLSVSSPMLCRGTSTYSEHHMWYIPPRDIAWNARIQLLYPKWLISSLAVGLHKQRHTLKAAPGCLTMSTGWMIPAGAAKTHPLWFSLHGLRRYIIRTCNFQRILYILTPVPNTLSPLIWFIIHIYLSNEWMDCEFFLACLLLPETEDRRMRNGPKSQSKMIKRQHCQLCTYRVFESVHSTYIYC